ncbi:MAG: hypothetical protein JXA94_05460 [Parachlamydiales bacterium]|nr:hypothetical protein [Parachlamydiales bacterium]
MSRWIQLFNYNYYNVQAELINVTMPDFNKALDLAHVSTTFLGKKEVTLDFSQNQNCPIRTTVDDLMQKVKADLPIPIEKMIFNRRSEWKLYKEEIDSSNKAIQKIQSLKRKSEDLVKNANIITRIFAFIRDYFYSNYQNLLKMCNSSLRISEKNYESNKPASEFLRFFKITLKDILAASVKFGFIYAAYKVSFELINVKYPKINQSLQ